MGERGTALNLLERARRCQQRGDIEGAARLYQASIAEWPTAEAHTCLGRVYALGRRYEEAIAECKQAIALDPTFGNPYNDIGAYLVELGRSDEAIPWLQRAMEAPRYAARQLPYLNLARIYESRGQYDRALTELTRAVEVIPDAPELTSAVRRLQALMN